MGQKNLVVRNITQLRACLADQPQSMARRGDMSQSHLPGEPVSLRAQKYVLRVAGQMVGIEHEER